MKDKRNKELWAVRLDYKEKEKLRELAEREGVNMSAMVRLLIERSHSRKQWT